MFPVQRDLTEHFSLLVISDFCYRRMGSVKWKMQIAVLQERLWVPLECCMKSVYETESNC